MRSPAHAGREHWNSYRNLNNTKKKRHPIKKKKTKNRATKTPCWCNEGQQKSQEWNQRV